MALGEKMARFHILCTRFSSLGDVVLTTSILAQLKERWGKDIHITYMTSQAFLPLLENHPYIDDVVPFSRRKGWAGIKELFSLVNEIYQKRKIDLFFDLHGTLRSILIGLRFFFIPRITVDKRTFERTLLTSFKVDFLSKQLKRFKDDRPTSFGELLLERTIRDIDEIFDFKFERQRLAEFVQRDSHNNIVDLGISSCASSFSNEGWEELAERCRVKPPFAILCPSASFPEKRWPIERFVEFTKNILENDRYSQMSFVILAGPTDHFCNAFDEIEDARLINLQGKTNIAESILLAKNAKWCMGNDTGVPHIAESTGTPAAFILGPTGEEFGFYPHLKRSQVVCQKLWCRPCTTNGKGNCIRKERFCLNNITVADVLESVDKMDRLIEEENI